MANKAKQKKSEDKKEQKKSEINSNRQFKIIVLIMGIIIIGIIIVIVINVQSTKFTYNGIPFKQVTYGNLLLYEGKVPLVNSKGEITNYYLINLRNDPRKLDDIKIELLDDTINFKTKKIVYISINEPIKKCEYSSVAVGEIDQLLMGNGAKTKGAINNQSYANETGLDFINCSNSSENTVIIFGSGEENSIIEQEENCYVLTFKECGDELKTAEKFIVTVLEQHMKKYNLS